MESKICSKCGTNKLICDFTKNSQSKSGYYPSCKECRKKSRLKNSSIEKLSNKLWREKNKEHLQKYRIYWRRYNPEYFLEWTNKNSDYHKNYYNENREEKLEYLKYRLKNDPIVKLTSNIRNRTTQYLKSKNHKIKSKIFEIVGCSPEYLKEHIEKQFTEGMSWELLGQYIHIDHKIPLSSAKTEEEIYNLCHYTNLQPLWAKDNLSKGSKIL